MKIQILLFAISFLSLQSLYSQEDNSNNPLENQKMHQFGITIKRTNYSYIPSEYNESKENPYFQIQKYEALKNKEQIINPVSFLYYNKNWNLFSEFSYYKLSYAHLYNQRISLYIPNLNQGIINPSFQPSLYNTITRRELKNNFYAKTDLNSSNQIFYGLGIRNLYKDNYGYQSGLTRESFSDSTNSYGLQIYFKYQLQIVSFLKMSISAEPFYTVGNRIRSRNQELYTYNSIQYDYSLSLYDKSAKNYFYGVDADFNLSFALNENLNLLIGYNYIYTKIRHEKNHSYRLYVENGQPLLNNLAMQSLTHQSHESKDHIYGYYIGLNAKF